MMDEVILSVSESKRLIAKGVASWPPILERFRSGMIVIAKGTTNRYVAEELLGESLGKHRFAWGIVAPPGTPRIRQDIPEIVIVNGSMTEMDFEDAIDSMSPGDIFVKGGNALNYGSRTAGVLSTSSTGGTIGRVYPRIFGSRIRLLIPIGLEKCVATPIEDLCSLMNAPEIGQSKLPTMFPLRGDIFTEIEAIETLFGLESIHVSSGGVAGYEGSVRLLVRGPREALDRLETLRESLRNEPPYKP